MTSATTTRSGRTIVAPKPNDHVPTPPQPEATPPASPAPSQDSIDAAAVIIDDNEADTEVSTESRGHWRSALLKKFDALSTALAIPGDANPSACRLFREIMRSSAYKSIVRPLIISNVDGGDAATAAPSPWTDPSKAPGAHVKLSGNVTKGNVNAATKALFDARYKDVMKRILSKGLAPLEKSNVRDALKSRYRTRADDSDYDPAALLPYDDTVVAPFTDAEVMKFLNSRDKGKGADLMGWSYDELKFLARDWKGCSWLTTIVNAIAQGRFNADHETAKLLTDTRGVALRKDEIDEENVRPIGIGTVWINIATALVASRHKSEFLSIAGPHQFGISVAGGVTSAGMILEVAISLNPDKAIGWSDGSNAFGSIEKPKMLAVSARVPGTEPIFALRVGIDAAVTYTFAPKSIGRDPATFDIEQQVGGAQGDSLTAYAYVAATGPVIDEAEKDSKANLVASVRVVDDNGWVASIKDLLNVSTTVSEALQRETGVVNSSLHIYKPQGLTDEELEAVSETPAQINNNGITYAGRPIGTDDFLNEWAEKRVDGIIECLDATELISTLGRDGTAQRLVYLWRKCILPKAEWVVQNVTPSISIPHMKRLDDAFFKAFLRATHSVDEYEKANDAEKARARTLFGLPADLAGMGFTPTAIIAEAAYVATWARNLKTVTASDTGLGIAKPAPDAETPVFLTDYQKTLNALRARLPPKVTEGLNIEDIWVKQTYGVQKAISEALHNITYNSLKLHASGGGGSMSERYAINSIIGGKSDEGGAWVSENPSTIMCSMSDTVFKQAVISRLMLPNLKTGPCASCAGPVDAFGAHAQVCKGNQGNRSKGHTFIKLALQYAAREAAHIVYNEPFCRDYFLRKAGAAGAAAAGTMKKRADVGIINLTTLASPAIFIDVTTTATTKTAVPTVAYLKAGDSAASAETDKVKDYDPWVIPDGHLIPFAVETTGAMGPLAKKLLLSIAALSGPPRYTSMRYRRYCAMISVAVQKMLAREYFKQRAMGVLSDTRAPAVAGTAAIAG